MHVHCSYKKFIDFIASNTCVLTSFVNRIFIANAIICELLLDYVVDSYRWGHSRFGAGHNNTSAVYPLHYHRLYGHHLCHWLHDLQHCLQEKTVSDTNTPASTAIVQ